MHRIERFLLFILLLLPQLATGQIVRKKQQYTNDTLTVKERISFHTNAVDWLLLTPNVGVEFDLSRMDWGRNTVYLYTKWNGNSKNAFRPSWVYNIGEVRGEFRHYFRTKPGGRLTPHDSIKPSIKDYWNYLFRTQKKKPRIWNAYYYGGYASYGSYSFKFSSEGKQGNFVSVGVTGGVGYPLYAYKHGSLDIEFGGSIGFVATKYDKYTYDEESQCFPKIEGGSKGWHLKGMPMITDLHVSFVYRFNGIKNKYKGINQAKIEAQQKRAALKAARRDSIKQVRALQREQKDALKDSLDLVTKARKDSLMRRFDLVKDSVMSKEDKAELKRLEKLEKEQAKLEKKKLKEQKEAEKALKKEKAKEEKLKEDKPKKEKDQKEKKEKKRKKDKAARKEDEA